MPQNRRGISSVVGALFFTVLMIAGFSVLSLALDAQTDIVTTQRMVSDIEIKKQQEDFGLLVSTDGNNILNVSVDNKGQNPVEISSIWITNKTLPTQPATRFEINYNDAFVPSGFNTNVLSSQTLQMIPDVYDIKVVSSYGTIKTTEFALGVAGSSGLRAELITDPPDVVLGKNVTVAMLVTNTGDELIRNVEPEMQVPGGSASIMSSSSHTPSIVNLNPGESVMFSWDYQVNGISGDDIIFSALARGDLVGIDDVFSNIATDSSLLRKAGEGGGADPDIVNDDLLARPQLFFIIPSSQGKSTEAQATWGINVVNPVNANMEVSKLIITAFAPGAQNNDKLFDRAGGDCNFNPISPVLGADPNWSCPSENALMWQSATPVIIPANSTRAFLTQVEPGKPSGSASLESVIVQGSVFTTLGSFGKSGYQSTMSGTTSPLVNVYLTDDTVTPRDDNNIFSTRTGIVPNSVQTFDIIFADMDNDDTTIINSGARLIINVPKEWTEVTVISDEGFVGTPVPVEFGDKSHQIIGITSGPLGDASNTNDRITFSARAPNITDDRLYVMYVLAQGMTSSNFSIGPLNEIVLQVDG
ncbi:MAG: hypothetical protein K5790_03525 [Nitrosopumilus sp.]|uniref:hypothetical protein n=1 Tax=Nitrosopumilus sp. TaxID=2024843 RepID=UPI00247EBA22|nr:hypothetical protein [Nitrosopumilus sp.]MCV0392349.1 hypothetical protein [Nitrosopumilus sp.]